MQMKIRNGLRQMSRGKLIGLSTGIVLVAAVLAVVIYILVWNQRNVPDTYADINQHFKYGSFGGEETMVPYWIWLVLPTVFEELLPNGPGEGYDRFGFITLYWTNGNKGTTLRRSHAPTATNAP